MISKELLSEVLKMELFDFDEGGYILPSNEQKTVYVVSGKDSPFYINIHELAFKVKEWAINNDIRMYSGYNFKSKLWKVNVMNKKGDTLSHFEYSTEPEAIFLAGQWILENR